MPIDKALDTVMRLGLVMELSEQGKIKLKAIPCSIAYDNLRKHWDHLLEQT